jgi:hypothetical protein
MLAKANRLTGKLQLAGISQRMVDYDSKSASPFVVALPLAAI